MNSKGFTLVELLLTIAILGLVIGIAVPSYIGISNAIRASQRENIIEKIEIAASKYAFDTGETIIFVDKLVTEGYIDSDDEDGTIDDPVNNERMNCYIVEMEKASDYYNAKFIDGKNYDVNGECDLNKLKKSGEEVSILVNGNEYVNTGEWLTGEIMLKAHSNNTLVIDCTNNKCVWSSSSGASKNGNDNYTISNISGILETRYTFQYTIYDEESSDVKRYKTSVDLKIDNAAPVIYGDQITVSDRFIYTDTKSVRIVASDGKGSGIKGYYLSKNISNCNSTEIENNYQTSNYFTVSENGTYTICVKDNVGKISTGSLNINYINEG